MTEDDFKALDHCVTEYTHGGEEAARRTLDAALSRARAEALEEAAQAFDQIQGSIGAKRAALIIRAKKGAEAPATISVERVREALLSERPLACQDNPAKWYTVTRVAERLDVPLDAATEAPKPTACECGHGPEKHDEKGWCFATLGPEKWCPCIRSTSTAPALEQCECGGEDSRCGRCGGTGLRP